MDITPTLIIPPKSTSFDSPEPDTKEILGRIKGYEIANQAITNINIANQTIVNNNIQTKSRTYDVIVDTSGNADYNNIEDAIDAVIALGGGDIFVHSGTYTITRQPATITVPINIIGTNSALVTINFNSASRNFIANSGTPYTTGTITGVTSGVNVTGSGTLWLANASAGQYLFLRTKWYQIASVTDNTHLVLAEAVDENFVTYATTYRIATLTRGIGFDGVTIKNSTGTAMAFTDVRDIFLTDVVLLTNNKGFVFTNCSNIFVNAVIVVSSTSNGWEMTNCGQCVARALYSGGNGGHGAVINVMEAAVFLSSSFNSNTSDGLNITSGADLDLNTLCNSNGGQGIELVATNNAILMRGGSCRNNTSDGIKLTASSDYCKIENYHFDTNGGWGINIAAATDDKTVVVGNSFNANVSGTITDSGTGTVSGNNTA